MPLVATTSESCVINYGEHVFDFQDGSRQVTQAEAEVLKKYAAEGGPVTVTVEEQTKRKGGS